MVSVALVGIVVLGCADSEEASLDVAADEVDEVDEFDEVDDVAGDAAATDGDATGAGSGSDDTDDGTEGVSELGSIDASDGGEGGERTERDDAWPDPIALDVEGRTGAGFVVELFELRADGSTIEVATRITNGQQQQAALNRRMSNRPTALIDDLDNEYPLVPPGDDEELLIGEGEIVEGDLAFVGPLASDATSLSLVINPGPFAGVRSGTNASEAPLVQIEDIPLASDG